jgi:hypothetical protein
LGPFLQFGLGIRRREEVMASTVVVMSIVDVVGQMVGIFVVWSVKLNQVCQHSIFGRSPDLSGDELGELSHWEYSL